MCGKEVISKEDVNGTLPVYFAAQEGTDLIMLLVVNVITNCGMLINIILQ